MTSGLDSGGPWELQDRMRAFLESLSSEIKECRTFVDAITRRRLKTRAQRILPAQPVTTARVRGKEQISETQLGGALRLGRAVRWPEPARRKTLL